jgi:predicted esterase
VWVIHGNRDEVNPLRHDRRVYVPLADAGARIRFTERDLLDHQVPPEWLLDGRLVKFLLADD